CEAAVEKALLAMPEILEVRADHKAGTAEIAASSTPDFEEMKRRIAEEDYELISAETKSGQGSEESEENP
ncbi:MAG: heavy-metal-associated domain-containing protein, partial [Clostridia bacterium]|nr:heavy-metal-associated domain-containing protein [Clostridia bacterium]